MDGNREDIVLAQLPNGVCIASSLIPDQLPPRHVYRVISAEGAVVSEHATLLELIDNMDHD